MASKIELYSLATPNGMKVSVAFEEMCFEYNPHTIHIGKNEQFTPEFIVINPNSKIPAITDPNGPGCPRPLSGNFILMVNPSMCLKVEPYCSTLRRRVEIPLPRSSIEVGNNSMGIFQMGGVGPMFGQFGHFFKYGKAKCDHPYPVERYSTEVKRLLGVLERKLERVFGWKRILHSRHGNLSLDSLPRLRL